MDTLQLLEKVAEEMSGWGKIKEYIENSGTWIAVVVIVFEIAKLLFYGISMAYASPGVAETLTTVWNTITFPLQLPKRAQSSNVVTDKDIRVARALLYARYNKAADKVQIAGKLYWKNHGTEH